jgi:hypothetical protein
LSRPYREYSPNDLQEETFADSPRLSIQAQQTQLPVGAEVPFIVEAEGEVQVELLSHNWALLDAVELHVTGTESASVHGPPGYRGRATLLAYHAELNGAHATEDLWLGSQSSLIGNLRPTDRGVEVSLSLLRPEPSPRQVELAIVPAADASRRPRYPPQVRITNTPVRRAVAEMHQVRSSYTADVASRLLVGFGLASVLSGLAFYLAVMTAKRVRPPEFSWVRSITVRSSWLFILLALFLMRHLVAFGLLFILSIVIFLIFLIMNCRRAAQGILRRTLSAYLFFVSWWTIAAVLVLQDEIPFPLGNRDTVLMFLTVFSYGILPALWLLGKDLRGSRRRRDWVFWAVT